MKVPTIHLNGTSRSELLRQWEDVGAAVSKAIEALSHASPNGRDYYPQGPAALGEAEREYQALIQNLSSVYDHAAAMVEAIAG